MKLEIEDRVALVVGASRGIGFAIAETLAAEGANVAVNYRSSGKDAEILADEIVAKGGKAKTYKADVSDFAAVKAMVDGVQRVRADLGIT